MSDLEAAALDNWQKKPHGVVLSEFAGEKTRACRDESMYVAHMCLYPCPLTSSSDLLAYLSPHCRMALFVESNLNITMVVQYITKLENTQNKC